MRVQASAVKQALGEHYLEIWRVQSDGDSPQAVQSIGVARTRYYCSNLSGTSTYCGDGDVCASTVEPVNESGRCRLQLRRPTYLYSTRPVSQRDSRNASTLGQDQSLSDVGKDFRQAKSWGAWRTRRM